MAEHHASTSSAGKSHFVIALITTLKQSSMLQAFVAHPDLMAPSLHQVQRELHCQPQLSRRDQATQVPFHLAVGFVVVVEIGVDVALIEGGCVRDGLARRSVRRVLSPRQTERIGPALERFCRLDRESFRTLWR